METFWYYRLTQVHPENAVKMKREMKAIKYATTRPLLGRVLKTGPMYFTHQVGGRVTFPDDYVCTCIVRMTISDVYKTKFLRQDQNNETKTTGSKQRHFADLTFK